MRILWTEEDAAYIRTRSERYAGAINIEPAWTEEVLDDANLLEVDPYPSSRIRAIGLVGYSRSAERVLVVIVYSDLDGDLHGMNAWPASGRDLNTYQEGASHGG